MGQINSILLSGKNRHGRLHQATFIWWAVFAALYLGCAFSLRQFILGFPLSQFDSIRAVVEQVSLVAIFSPVGILPSMMLEYIRKLYPSIEIAPEIGAQEVSFQRKILFGIVTLLLLPVAREIFTSVVLPTRK